MYLCPLDNSTCATYAAITELEAPPPVVQQASAPLRLGIESWPAAHWLVSLSTSAVVAQISIPCNRVRQCLLSLCLVLNGYRAPGTPRAPSTQTACCGQPPRVYCMFCRMYTTTTTSSCLRPGSGDVFQLPVDGPTVFSSRGAPVHAAFQAVQVAASALTHHCILPCNSSCSERARLYRTEKACTNGLLSQM